jgi:hypothetical protein
MDGFINETGEFVLDPQATVAARNEELYLSTVHYACKKRHSENCGCRRRGFLCLAGCGCGGMCADGAHLDAVGHKPTLFSALPSLLQPRAQTRLWERLIRVAALMMITLSAHLSSQGDADSGAKSLLRVLEGLTDSDSNSAVSETLDREQQQLYVNASGLKELLV